MRKLTDIFTDKIRQYEALDLLDGDAYECHCTAALTNDLEPAGERVLAKNVWGRGLAQMLASVSPDMHDEFDITYMKDALAPFGLVYYGCCEPLDKKINILRKIPNLRKISITPWADVDIAADAMGKDYVMANKPRPASVSMKLDEDVLRAEVGRTLSAVKRNGCSCDIVLKDVSTIGGDLNNLVRWEQTVMGMVQNF